MNIDLNSDLGESFGAYKMGLDEDVIPLVSSVNVACGFHAGDPSVMHKTLILAKKHDTAIGAHPSFPDLLGFGRRNMAITTQEAKDYILYQLGALFGFAKVYDMNIQHVKPHGALYNMAAVDYDLALAMCEAVASFDEKIIFLALSGSEMVNAAHKVGLRVAQEVFADRAYNDDGTLVSRKIPGAVITDSKQALEQVLKMVKEQKVISISGKEVALKADSICVHGDNVKALDFVKNIKESLQNEGVQIRALKDLA